MKVPVHIVRTYADWLALGVDYAKVHVADVETCGTDPKNGKLLGVALTPLDGTFANGAAAAYVVVQEYVFGKSEWVGNNIEDKVLIEEYGNNLVLQDTSVGSIIKYTGRRPTYVAGLYSALKHFFSTVKLVGHNYCYDRGWLDHFFEVRTYWHADTRLMWHMSSAPAKADGYALKDAQVRVLGWDARGDEELAEQVKARGGSLSNGDHYLADTDVLAYYAGLDAHSTALLYQATRIHFDKHDQWRLLADMMQLSELLDRNTRLGIRVDVPRLERVTAELKSGMEAAREDLKGRLSGYVARMEEGWREEKAASFSTAPAGQKAREKFLQDPSRWDKFNPGSDHQKRELFYDVMGLPVVKMVKPRKDKKTGRRVYSKNPATTQDAISLSIIQSGRRDLVPVLEAYERAEKLETLHNNFSSKWLKAVKRGRIHPPFNPCGTVSYRISGYAPYFLNLPFDEREMMECFSCDEGYGGVHSDLVSVEPTLTAHYSQDPHLLKVFRDGLGDVYLDLARTLFPGDVELQRGYDPNAPCTAEIKERFKAQRKKAKVVQLAVQYTGTEYTVSTNLRCSLEEGALLVENYWKHFHRVARMNELIVKLHDKQGWIRNAAGRVIRMPWPEHKDAPNRFFQSGGHDILTMWALTIDRMCRERVIAARPVLVDIHDSTSWQAPLSQVPDLKQVFADALTEVNDKVKLTIPVRAEVKEFTTLAGLKGDETYVEETL